MVTIEVSEDIWRTLMLKKRPGDSFDDVLRRELLAEPEQDEREPDDQPDPRARAEPAPYADVEFPSGVDRTEAIAAIEAAAALIREQGKATMREIVNEIMPEHPVGYEVETLEKGDRFRGSWWRAVVKPGLASNPNIEKPSGGQRAWRWVGE